MKYRNFWLIKKNEKLMVKVVQWAQRNKVKVESISKREILLALKEEK